VFREHCGLDILKSGTIQSKPEAQKTAWIVRMGW
jgi:hypothetical protein